MTPPEIANLIIREKVEERLRLILLILKTVTVTLWSGLAALLFFYGFDYPLMEVICFIIGSALALIFWRRKILMEKMVQYLEYEIRNELNWFS